MDEEQVNETVVQRHIAAAETHLLEASTTTNVYQRASHSAAANARIRLAELLFNMEKQE